MGPSNLDCAEDDLEGLEIRSGHRSTGNGDFMAAKTIQTILVEVVAGERTRTPARHGAPGKIHSPSGSLEVFGESASTTSSFLEIGI
jgi:hypothetical protein